MRTPRIAAAASVALLFLPALVVSAVSQRVPVVTQVQGVVFYRTFLMIGVASGAPTVTPRLTLTYRSPADGSIQAPTLTLPEPIAGGQAQTFEDVVQSFKDAGAIRAQDLPVGLFGTLEVAADGLTDPTQLSLVARTFSPATGGGTNGIAYVGRDTESAGTSWQLVTFVRNGTFGADGTTRANIGFVNEGETAVDFRVTYVDAATGSKIKDFTISSALGHAIDPGEVVQLNNVFASSGVPASTRLMSVMAAPITAGRISGYAVQLDSVTNDGSFFLMNEVPGP
ncbi:MAG TPA: hypothetical protein VGK26_09435 [Thermoanaerobaculia bacterium]|jgi:hypothetical protein